MLIVHTVAVDSAALMQRAEGSLMPPDGSTTLPRGFPLILTGSGQMHWGAFCFLLDLYRLDSSRDRRKTLQTYAESLKSWLQHLEASHADWTRPAPRLLSDYRTALTSGLGGQKRASNATVNLRTVVVREFYLYLNSWTSWRMLDASLRIEAAPIARFLDSAQKIGRAKGYRKRPRALTSDEVGALGAALKSPYSLIFKWTIATGIRRSTAVSLSLDDLPPEVRRLAYIQVTVKGGRRIEIPVTEGLQRSTSDYIATLRNKYLARSGTATSSIFINSRGYPVSSSSYYQAFRRAAKLTGIDVSPHAARHTFAVHMKAALERFAEQGAQLNPIKVLQHILGHSSARTTEIYLESVNAVDAGVLRALIETEEMAP